MELGGSHGRWAKEKSQKKGLMETGSELRNKAAGGFWKEWAETCSQGTAKGGEGRSQGVGERRFRDEDEGGQALVTSKRD